MTNIERAFLDTISYVEGTLGVSNNGYDVSVNYRVIIGWTENTSIVHGNKLWLDSKLNSTATGRYQFTYDTWIGTNGNKNAPMTKSNQDNAALFLLNNRKPTGFDNSSITNPSQFSILINQLKKNTWVGFQKKSLSDCFNIFTQALNKYNGN